MGWTGKKNESPSRRPSDPPKFHEHGKDEKRLSLVRKTHKATHASEAKTGLVRKRFGPSPANNDPASWWEVRWNVSYFCYPCNTGAGRKVHHIVIQQFCLATTITVGNSFCMSLVHGVIWKDTTKIVIFCNLHPGQNMNQQSKGARLCKKAFSCSLECRREMLKLVNYHGRKFDNTAFRDALVSVFFILRGEADSFPRQAMMENHTRERESKEKLAQESYAGRK